MEIAVSDMIVSLSVALDYVEKELLGIANYHCQRIAYLSYRMGQEFGLSKEVCTALAEAAILHDNALKEFIEDESVINEDGIPIPKHDEKLMTKHCTAGENNIKKLPFYHLIEDAVLYHHECADGSGAFSKLADEIPLTARIIHITDLADATWNLSDVTPEKHRDVLNWVKEKEGTFFDSECAEKFIAVCTYEQLKLLDSDKACNAVRELLGSEVEEVSTKTLVSFSDIFAQIIDYKSHFTCSHSLGIAEKSRQMAKHYGWDEETQDQMYIAGAFHDIGKLLIHNDILEKAGRLTQNEYQTMQDHAKATYDILSKIKGMENITLWASLHHEKLDGSGYPFGKTAAELDKKERLLACMDIYQALVEERPYKSGMPHQEAMEILNKMVAANQLDECITKDIDSYFGTAAI